MKASNFLNLDVADLVKGVVLAAITAALTIVSQTIDAGSLTFDWAMVGKVTLLAVLGYLTKNLFTNSKGEFAAK